MTKTTFDYLLAIDFEATCDENYAEPSKVLVPRGKGEIIEVPFVVVDTSLLGQALADNEEKVNPIVHYQQLYVRPELTPITAYCSQLTGITEAQVSDAPTLKQVLQEVDQWIEEHILQKGKTFCFVTHGMYDLRNMLWLESKAKGFFQDLPMHWWRFFDITAETLKWHHAKNGKSEQDLNEEPVASQSEHVGHALHHSKKQNQQILSLDLDPKHPRRFSRRVALHRLCMELGIQPNGRLHSGLEDAKLIARLISLIHRPVTEEASPVFQEPFDILAEQNAFIAAQSTCAHLEGMPFRLAESDLKSWLAEGGFADDLEELWSLQTADQQPSGCAYLTFKTHERALDFLKIMHGTPIQERCVIASPVLKDELELVKESLVCFPEHIEPQQHKIQASGSGIDDEAWSCNICKFTNRHARPSCYKCNGSHPDPSKFHHRSKDNWICAVCRSYNFAYRFTCVKCKRPSPNPPPVAKPRRKQAGDWTCPTPICRAVNYGSRYSCYRCDAYNPIVQAQHQQKENGGSVKVKMTKKNMQKEAAAASFDVNVGGQFACLSLEDDS